MDIQMDSQTYSDSKCHT